MKITIKQQFIMDQQEIDSLNKLPDNLPDNHLTKKQITFVDDIYFKYIAKGIDNQNMAREMFIVEKSEKWPSGPRVKGYEAKRMIIDNLVYLNSIKNDQERIIRLFHAALSCRHKYAKFVYHVFSIE